jgi:hypothetical protein
MFLDLVELERMAIRASYSDVHFHKVDLMGILINGEVKTKNSFEMFFSESLRIS